MNTAFFSQQRQKLSTFKNSTAPERIQKIKDLREAINFFREDLKQALYQDFNKPPIESDLTEIQPCVSSLNFIIKNLKSWMRPVKVKASILILGTQSTIQYEPRGQVLVISPWNYPLYLSLIPVAEAIAAGNAVVLKPSEFTPHTNQVLVKLFQKAFKADEVIVIEGDANVATELLKLPFHHIFFTGSTAVGKIVMEAASRTLASVTLELGGKSPCIIDHDVDLADAVKKIVWGKFVNAGQTCIAPDFVLVPESLRKDFLEACQKAVREIYQDQQNIAHLINNRHRDRIKNLVSEAMTDGAQLICGNKSGETTNYFSPTILLNPKLTSKIMQEEIFGPVMPVLTYKESHEVITILNRFPRPLSLYVFSKNSKQQDYFINNIISGSVAINEIILQVSNHHLPFGGINDSGLGNYHGEFGFKTFSHQRSILKRRINIGVDYFYPPYSATKQKVVDFIFEKFNRFL